jgi:hypothetical protein
MSGRALVRLATLAARAEKAAGGSALAEAEAIQTARDLGVVLPQRLNRAAASLRRLPVSTECSSLDPEKRCDSPTCTKLTVHASGWLGAILLCCERSSAAWYRWCRHVARSPNSVFQVTSV